MILEQRHWTDGEGWTLPHQFGAAPSPQLVLYFGARAALDDARSSLRAEYPAARLLGCSTAGEICGTTVAESSVVATAIQLEHSTVRVVHRALDDATASRRVGQLIADDLAGDGLVHVFVLARGLAVNGSDLVKGLSAMLPSPVSVTGGLAGDGERFERTRVLLDDVEDDQGVVAVGFYGDRLRIGCGSLGGWDQFGPDRLVTRSAGNVLYELDGNSALDLYRTYLGPHAAGLPASGLRFPLSIRGANGGAGVVRTILGIDEAAGSLIFAGDLPEGSYVRLMKANVDRLIDGAHGAATASCRGVDGFQPQLALLISCVGRRLVLKQRVEEEVESVREVLGPNVVLSGFYSYGEIAPFSTAVGCELHNQTMTITTFAEV
jgi:hypothetical protein